jgi:hypothetical protein
MARWLRDTPPDPEKSQTFIRDVIGWYVASILPIASTQLK